MEKPSYEEMEKIIQKLKEENEKIVNENAQLQAKILEMQFMIKNYIIQD